MHLFALGIKDLGVSLVGILRVNFARVLGLQLLLEVASGLLGILAGLGHLARVLCAQDVVVCGRWVEPDIES
jgi:hypothetical protein